jgi:hypothetical protein
MTNNRIVDVCFDIMEENNASTKMREDFEKTINMLSSKTLDQQILDEFIAACKRNNFIDWFTKNKSLPIHHIRQEDCFAETAREEICYRRGYVQGMAETQQLLNKFLPAAVLAKYEEWRLSEFFKVMQSPGSAPEFTRTEIENYIIMKKK